jgi:hypothetical protein
MICRHVIFTHVGAVFHEDFKYVLIFTVAYVFKKLWGIFDRYDRNNENFLLRMLSLYMSIDVEFNADSEYVHCFGNYWIYMGGMGQKRCFLDIFWARYKLYHYILNIRGYIRSFCAWPFLNACCIYFVYSIWSHIFRNRKWLA